MDIVATPPPARLLASVNLNAPRGELEDALLAWASGLGEGAIHDRQGMHALRVLLLNRLDDQARHTAMDLYMALGALDARERCDDASWDALLEAWQQYRHSTDARTEYAGDMEQLRRLQDRFGGILLLGRGAPMVLLIPCTDGTWVQMGWKVVLQLASSPLTDARPPHVLQRFVEP